MSDCSESPSVLRRRPFSQLQNIQILNLSDSILNASHASSKSSPKEILVDGTKSWPRLFGLANSEKPKDFDVSYSSSVESNNLESPLVAQPPRSRPFTRRQRRKSDNVFNVSYCSSSVESTKSSDQVASPLVRTRPFTRSRGKENYNTFKDTSYQSSCAENTSKSEISAINSSLPKLFRNRNRSRNKKRSNTSCVSNDSSLFGQQKLNDVLDDISYMPSPANSSIQDLSFKVPRPFKMRRKKRADESMFDISCKSSEDGSLNESKSSHLEKCSKLFKGKNPSSTLLNDLTYMSSENDFNSPVTCESLESENESDAMEVDDVQRASIATKDKFFPELHISKLTNHSTATSLDLSAGSQDEENNSFSAEPNFESEKEKLNTTDKLDNTSLENVSLFLLTPPRRSKASTTTCKNFQKEKEPSSTANNNAEALSLNERQSPLSSQFEIPESTAFVLTSHRPSITSTTNCESLQNEKELSTAGDDAEAVSFDERKKPFSRQFEIPESTMPDVTYDSSKLEINESNSNRNHRLFANNRSGENTNLSNITYNSSIERNNVTSTSSLITRAMRKRSLDASKNTSVQTNSIVDQEERISISANASRASATNKVLLNNTSIQRGSFINKIESTLASMKERSYNINHSYNTNEIKLNDTSKSTLDNDENVSISKPRPFNKLHNNLESSFPCTSYVASQETPVSVDKAPCVKKLFSRSSCPPNMSFSITYEESVDNTHENTAEPSSSSSEESEVSSEKSSEEDSSSDEEEDHEDKSVDKEESNVEEITESGRIDEELEKEIIGDDNRTIEAESIHEELEMSAVNDIDSDHAPDQVDEEHISLNDVDASSSVDGTFNASVTSRANSELCRESSFNTIENIFMTSQNNITVLTEKPKNTDQLSKSLDLDEFKKAIEDKIACVRKAAMERVTNKHKLCYQESPKSKKKKLSKKEVATTNKYPRPKLFKPARWANKRLYDYLSKCLEYNGLNRMLEAEKVVKLIYETIQIVTHSTTHQRNAIQRLKVELATRKIILTTFDFYNFIRDYLPRHFEDKVIPCVQPYTNAVWPPKDNMKESDPIII